MFFRGKEFTIFRNLGPAKPRGHGHAIFRNLGPAKPQGREHAIFGNLESAKSRSREHASLESRTREVTNFGGRLIRESVGSLVRKSRTGKFMNQ
jgi:hypothetical protein